MHWIKTTVVVGCLAIAAVISAADEPPTAATITALADELSNWGRWGKADQLGTLNLITPHKRIEAAAEVKSGVSVSLAVEMLTDEAPDNPSPLEHEMVAAPSDSNEWAVDSLSVTFHGFGHSHIDALCHLSHDGTYYNGIDVAEVTEAGCGQASIANIGHGIFTRGVLMDIPRLKGVKWLEPGTPVMVEDLEAWEKRAGVRVGSGDAVLIRTGRWAHRAERGPIPGGFAGLHFTTVRWLKERDVAVIGSDAGLDVFPSGVEGVGAPVHKLVLVALGMPILDTMELESVAEKAAELGRWTFLLTAAPLRLPAGTGSPLNAIATF